ncbi:Dephospho-CoA kinase (Dephosphocoenzyme A kinase) (COAE) [Fusarium chlamydosporum]
MDGLWEVLADLDRGEPVEEEEGISPHEEKEIQKQDTTEAQVDEIQDSQDDDDEAFSPIRQTSQPPPPEKSPSKLTPHPEVILITHFSSLLTSLFTHRERSAAHAALQLLGSHLRDLSRNLSSSPLILLLNSTSPTFSGPAPIATTATTPPAKQTFIDPTLRSIFNPPSTTGYSSRRTKPNFGLSFTQLLDLHILCTRIPKARNDAEVAVQQRSGEEAKMVWVVEVLLDELGEALAQCLQESECVMVERNSAADCLREPLVNTLPLKCRQLKKGFGECKRGMVDMRKRFRGNMPVAYRTMEQAEEGQGYQLYAGRPAFAGGVKKTDGNEPIPQDWREVENEKWKAEQAAMAQEKK